MGVVELCVRKYLLQLGKREASILFYGSTHYNRVMSSCHIYGIIISTDASLQKNI